MKKPKEPMIRIQVQLPKFYKGALDALRREGYSASAYLRYLFEQDIEHRLESGWSPFKGWSPKMKALIHQCVEEVARMKAERSRRRATAMGLKKA